MKDKMSIWVWYSDAPYSGYLFHGNPNHGVPPYHFGGIENLLFGDRLVWAHTRKVLEMDAGIMWWNERFPKQRVKPKSVMVEIRPYYKRIKKESEVNDGK